MRNLLLLLICPLAFTPILVAQDARPTAPPWREKVAEAMPLLGHRNWILIVDSAYPLQSSPGIEIIDTGAPQLEVVRHVLFTIDRSIHVRPDILMDTELPFVPEQDAPGAGAYRTEIADLLRAYPIESLPHDHILATIEEASRHFNILVLKTNMAIPYTSVFIRLDCKYWSADAEKRLRTRMSTGTPAATKGSTGQPDQ
jgi:hypothetical protein